jgi:tRNA(Ile2) C34 agmatinyltransferase TiaS
VSPAVLEAPLTMTLERSLSEAWEALEHDHAVECPLCNGEMHPRWSAGSGIVGGRCDDCGTTLE